MFFRKESVENAARSYDDGTFSWRRMRGAVALPKRRDADKAYVSGLISKRSSRSSSNQTSRQPGPIAVRCTHASSRPHLTMPPKQRSSAPQTVPGTPFSAAKPKSSNDAQDILQGVWNRYVEKTTQRTKLLDSFMAFLVVVGALQFLYVVLVGNFVSTTLNPCILH
jgi:hypothetical protein